MDGTVFLKCFVNTLLAEVSPCFVMRCAGKWHLDNCIHQSIVQHGKFKQVLSANFTLGFTVEPLLESA